MTRLSSVFTVIALTALLLAGCQSKSKQAPEKQETVADRPDTTSKNNTTPGTDKPADTSLKLTAGKDTTHQTPGAVTMTMLFDNYEEGDYPHLLFRDVAAGKEYDFRFTGDNNYSGIPLLPEDNTASFGQKANPAYLKKLFVVDAVKKNVVDGDLQGRAFKTKAWVITSLQLK